MQVNQNTEVLIIEAIFTDPQGQSNSTKLLRTIKANGAGDPVDVNNFPMALASIDPGASLSINPLIHGTTQVVAQFTQATSGDGVIDQWGSVYTPISDLD